MLRAIESPEQRSYHNFVKTKGMNKKYKDIDAAFRSMQRSVTRLSSSRQNDSNNCVKLVVEGPSFAYNQILRLAGLITEVSYFEKDRAATVAESFDPAISRSIPKAPAEGLLLADQRFNAGLLVIDESAQRAIEQFKSDLGAELSQSCLMPALRHLVYLELHRDNFDKTQALNFFKRHAEWHSKAV